METSKMLGLSTGNIKESTAQWIKEESENSLGIVVYNKKNYGWFIPVPDELEEKNIPDDLLIIFNYAKKNDYEWIMLDCNIEVSEKFDIYEW